MQGFFSYAHGQNKQIYLTHAHRYHLLRFFSDDKPIFNGHLHGRTAHSNACPTPP